MLCILTSTNSCRFFLCVYRIANDNYAPHTAQNHPNFKQALEFLKTIIIGTTALYDAGDKATIANFELECQKSNNATFMHTYIYTPTYTHKH
jgi:hypothetical protein